MMGMGNKAVRLEMTRRFAGLLVLLCLLIVAGCGGKDAKEAKEVNDFGASNQTIVQESGIASTSSQLKGNDSNAVKMDAKSEKPSVKIQNSSEPANQTSEGFQAIGSTPSGASIHDGALSRKIMYKANLVMEVEEYGTAQTEIQNLTALHGGYILQFAENHSEHEKSGNFVMKVPASGFSSFLDALNKLDNLKFQRSIQGQDVSEEYVDLNARLKAKQTEESRLLVFIEKAGKTDELVAFSNQLGKVQEEIEKIKGRMRYLDQNVAYSTIEMRLYQKIKPTQQTNKSQQALWSKAGDAMQMSANLLFRVFKGLVVFFAGALPVLLVLAFVAAPLIYVLRKRRLVFKSNIIHSRSVSESSEKQ